MEAAGGYQHRLFPFPWCACGSVTVRVSGTEDGIVTTASSRLHSPVFVVFGGGTVLCCCEAVWYVSYSWLFGYFFTSGWLLCVCRLSIVIMFVRVVVSDPNSTHSTHQRVNPSRQKENENYALMNTVCMMIKLIDYRPVRRMGSLRRRGWYDQKQRQTLCLLRVAFGTAE